MTVSFGNLFLALVLYNMKFDLFSFSNNKLESNHLAILFNDELISCDNNLQFFSIVYNSKVSSAKQIIFGSELVLKISLRKRIKSQGPRMVPWGTPTLTVLESE